MQLVVFRADSSSLIGSGHIMRCLNLAKVLSTYGVTSLFVCRDHIGNKINYIENHFPVVTLAEPSHHQNTQSTGLSYRSEYVNWLGASQELDVNQFFKAVISFSDICPDWVVVDHYSLDASWHSRAKVFFADKYGKTPNICVLDDLADRYYDADLLIDTTYEPSTSTSRYSNLVPDHCRTLLGPYYTCLDPEFSIYNDRSTKLTPRSLKCLIFLGGGNTLEYCKSIFNFLLACDLPLEYHFVLPCCDSDFSYFASKSSSTANILVYRSLPSLANLMSECDLCIGACGVTTWERACFNLPTIAYSVASNQVPSALSLHSQKYLNYLGSISDFNPAILYVALQNIIYNSSSFSSGFYLTDGNGVHRIASIIANTFNFLPRRVIPVDEYILYYWANDPSVRRVSFSPSFISKEAHHQWFTNGLSLETRIHYIVELNNRAPVAQVRFDFDPTYSICEIDISLDRCIRRLGFASVILRQCIDTLRSELSHSFSITASVLHSNIPSQNLFASLGFQHQPANHQLPDHISYVLHVV